MEQSYEQNYARRVRRPWIFHYGMMRKVCFAAMLVCGTLPISPHPLPWGG